MKLTAAGVSVKFGVYDNKSDLNLDLIESLACDVSGLGIVYFKINLKQVVSLVLDSSIIF